MFGLYKHKFHNFQKIHDNPPFVFILITTKPVLTLFKFPSSFNSLSMSLTNFSQTFFQAFFVADLDYEGFNYETSSVDQILSASVTLKDTINTIR